MRWPIWITVTVNGSGRSLLFLCVDFLLESLNFQLLFISYIIPRPEAFILFPDFHCCHPLTSVTLTTVQLHSFLLFYHSQDNRNDSSCTPISPQFHVHLYSPALSRLSHSSTQFALYHPTILMLLCCRLALTRTCASQSRLNSLFLSYPNSSF